MLKKPPYQGTVVRADGIRVACSPSWTWSTYSSATVSSETGTWSSVKTPGFKNIKPRNRPNNPFSATYNYTEWKPGWQANGVCQWDGYLQSFKSGSSFAVPTVALSTDTPARSKLLSSLKGSSVNLAQAYAERKQTADLIARNVNRIASAAMAIRRGNLRHASNLFGMRHPPKLRNEISPGARNLSNHWLEYSYGWRPLLNDIYGSCELIAKTYYENRPTIIKSNHSETYVWKDFTLFYDSNYGYREKLVAHCKQSTSYVVAFSEDSSFSQKMASTGITNPLLLAWELIPYSFVVDWFVPVGAYLGNLDATVGLSFRGGTVTTRKDFVGNSSWVSYKAPLNSNYRQSGLGRSIYSSSKTRSVLATFPSPVLEINPHLGVSRALSGLALLTQAFKR